LAIRWKASAVTLAGSISPSKRTMVSRSSLTSSSPLAGEIWSIPTAVATAKANVSGWAALPARSVAAGPITNR
jgi:hypothetical protein